MQFGLHFDMGERTNKIPWIMNGFIEDYLNDPTTAIASAIRCSNDLSWADEVDENQVYEALASGQFHLYESIIFSPDTEDFLARNPVRPVA